MSGTSFGPQRRKRQADVALRLAQARVQSIQDDEPGDQVAAAEALLEDAAATGMSITETVAMAKRLDTTLASKQSKLVEADAAVVQRYSSEHLATCLRELAGPCPNLAKHATGLATLPPALGVNIVERRTAGIATDACDALACLQGLRPRQSNLPQALDAQWDRLHRLHLDQDCLRASDADLPKTPSPCWLDGVCYCSTEGRKLWQFRNSVIKAIKAGFPRANPEGHKALAGSFVVLRFSPKVLGPVDGANDELAAFWGLSER